MSSELQNDTENAQTVAITPRDAAFKTQGVGTCVMVPWEFHQNRPVNSARKARTTNHGSHFITLHHLETVYTVVIVGLTTQPRVYL